MKKGVIKTLFLLLILVILIYNPLSARLFTLAIAIIYDLDVQLFYNLVKVESSFRSLAISKKGAIGLGQIMPSTAKYIIPKIPVILLWCPIVNLITAAKYIKYLIAKYNHNWSIALAAYNWGETNVDKKIKNLQINTDKKYKNIFKDIPESYSYINKIMHAE